MEDGLHILLLISAYLKSVVLSYCFTFQYMLTVIADIDSDISRGFVYLFVYFINGILKTL